MEQAKPALPPALRIDLPVARRNLRNQRPLHLSEIAGNAAKTPWSFALSSPALNMPYRPFSAGFCFWFFPAVSGQGDGNNAPPQVYTPCNLTREGLPLFLCAQGAKSHKTGPFHSLPCGTAPRASSERQHRQRLGAPLSPLSEEPLRVGAELHNAERLSPKHPAFMAYGVTA
jgi:hypothetical protein